MVRGPLVTLVRCRRRTDPNCHRSIDSLGVFDVRRESRATSDAIWPSDNATSDVIYQRVRGCREPGVCEDDLAPNLDAKLPFSQRLPKDALRGRGMPTRVLRAGREESAFMTKSGKSPTR